MTSKSNGRYGGDRATPKISEQAVGDILESDFKIARHWMDVKIIGVLERQIKKWNLPTRPTKTSDTRSAAFASLLSVELDAIPPANLRELVTSAILKHLPEAAMEIKAVEEESTRVYLAALANAKSGDRPEAAQ